MLSGVRHLLEEAFLAREERALPPGLVAQAPREAEPYWAWLREITHAHPAYTHPLYDVHLRNHATYEDVRYFLTQESAIDANTDDFLALLQVGATDTMKMEIATNYWDEMGNGVPEGCHSTLFLQACAVAGVDFAEGLAALETESLACGNLQLLVSLQRRYFYMGIGYFLVTEHMAPGRFKNLMHAWQRCGLEETGRG